MITLYDFLKPHVSDGSVPGAVALVARGDRIEAEAAGSADAEGTAFMARDSIFRIASITKPVTASAVMMLVDDGRIALDDPVAPWLPELASPVVVRTPAGPIDDVVPAAGPITVLDLLTSRAGYGFPSDFSLPAVGPLFSDLKQGPPQPQNVADPDEWMATLSRIPLLHQPGEAWLYNTCSDIQGVLIARVSGRPLPEFLAERLFEPLGMADTGFEVPAGEIDRFTSYYRTDPPGGFRESRRRGSRDLAQREAGRGRSGERGWWSPAGGRVECGWAADGVRPGGGRSLSRIHEATPACCTPTGVPWPGDSSADVALECRESRTSVCVRALSSSSWSRRASSRESRAAAASRERQSSALPSTPTRRASSSTTTVRPERRRRRPFGFTRPAFSASQAPHIL